MCGIAGIFNPPGRSLPLNLIKRVSNSIKHRGDDDEGICFIDSINDSFSSFSCDDSDPEIKGLLPNQNNFKDYFDICLIHRRFSIIDLSVNGHQPFLDSEKKFAICFNGEIYNYVEVREELEGKGIKFKTSSDTEVFLEAFKFWGVNCFEKLNGFWSVALYDLNRKTLVLSRDRLGKKPLYWSKIDHTIYFASEIKALLEIPGINNAKSVNEEMLWHWTVDGLRDTANKTFFSNINSLPQGSYVIVTEKFPVGVVKYWDPPVKRLKDSEISEEEAAKEIKEILIDAVKIRLRSDVPLCVELSGGMDSSTLVAIASIVSNKKIKTFTVRFPEKEWDEEPFARSVAQRYNTEYIVIENPVTDFWSGIKEFTYLEEEPYHSPNLNSNQATWGAMRFMGIKVSLNGAAGDELFAGYGNYYLNAQLENVANLKLVDFFKNLNWTENESRLKSFLHPFIYLTEKKAGFNLLLASKYRESSKGFLKVSKKGDYIRELSLTSMLRKELTDTKIPYWLSSGDKGYMGLPLEVRAPFLDYRLVDFVSTLPFNYLVKNGWQKWILRKAVEDILPADVVWRKRKMGFPFPFNTFYDNNRAIFQHIVDKMNNPFLELKQKDIFVKDWRIISFILWYEYFFNNNIQLFEQISQMNQKSKMQSGFVPGYLKYYTDK